MKRYTFDTRRKSEICNIQQKIHRLYKIRGFFATRRKSKICNIQQKIHKQYRIRGFFAAFSIAYDVDVG